MTKLLITLLVSLSLQGCAMWNTITFSNAPNSENKQVQQYGFEYIWDIESQENLLNSVGNNLSGTSRDNFDKAINNCVVSPTAAPLLILAPVVAKYLIEAGFEKAKDYTDELQERGIKKYSTSLVVFDENPISKGILGGENPKAGSTRGCLVFFRQNGTDKKIGMMTVLQLFAYNETMKFVPTYLRLDNAIALTAEEDDKNYGVIDINFIINTKASGETYAKKGTKTADIGTIQLDLNSVPIAGEAKMGKEDNYCSLSQSLAKNNACFLSSKTIELPDRASKDIEFNITITETGAHVADAKKSSEILKNLKDVAGSKTEEFVKEQLK